MGGTAGVSDINFLQLDDGGNPLNASDWTLTTHALTDATTGAVLKHNSGLDFDGDGNLVDIIEKPAAPPSNVAIGGIYLFDERFWTYLDEAVGLSEVGFSISDVTKRYVEDGDAVVHNLGESTWIDCGTPMSLLRAGNMASEGIINAGPEFKGG